MSRARTWCFTDNRPERVREAFNPDLPEPFGNSSDEYREYADWLWRRLSDNDGRYLVLQFERGEVEGRLHAQGYVEFTKPIRFESVRRLLSGCHVESRQGDRNAARDYCRKEES